MAYNLIGNGYQNSAITNFYSTVINGEQNLASGQGSFISNGFGNVASGPHSTVINGRINTASGSYSSIINGSDNTNNGTFCTIINGRDNTVSGLNSTIVGGSSNVLSGQNSVIIASTNTSFFGNNTLVTTNLRAAENSGIIYSAGTDLYQIFAGTETITNVQPGTNITTGGTTTNPTINLVASPSINALTLSGDISSSASARFTQNISANTLSLNEIYYTNNDRTVGVGVTYGRAREGFLTAFTTSSAVTYVSLMTMPLSTGLSIKAHIIGVVSSPSPPVVGGELMALYRRLSFGAPALVGSQNKIRNSTLTYTDFSFTISGDQIGINLTGSTTEMNWYIKYEWLNF